MLRPLKICGFAMGLFWQGFALADGCENSYEKTIPYSKPIVDQAGKVSLNNLVTLRYDCNTFFADATGGIEAGFFGAKAQLIEGRVSADNGVNNSHLIANVLVMGYEVAHQDVDLGSVYKHTFKPDHDIDLAQTTLIQIGPLPLPIRYGIQGTGELMVDAGMRNFGTELTATPRALAHGYVQSSVDLQVIYGSARGEILLVDGALTNKFGVRFSPSAEQPTIKFDVTGAIKSKSLEGSVTARAAKSSERGGQDFEKVLAQWNGYDVNSKIYTESGKIADLPATAAKKVARK